MSFVLVFKNDVRLPKRVAKNFKMLLRIIRRQYGDQLPDRFSLQYEDSENDRIVLSNEEDFLTMAGAESSKAINIHILEAADDAVTFISKSDIASDSEENRKRECTGDDEFNQAGSPWKHRNHHGPGGRMGKHWHHHDFEGGMGKHGPHHGFEGSMGKHGPHHDFEGGMGKHGPHHGFEGRMAHKQAKHQAKKEMMKTVAKESFLEELPTIALLVKELLQAPHQQADMNMKPINKESIINQIKSQLKEEPKAIHNHIICDSCGMNPILGARYKCTVANDFDLCENCEALGTHPYPLLKIRTEAQRPYKVITVIDEDEADRVSHLNELKKIAEKSKDLIKPKKNACSKKLQKKAKSPLKKEPIIKEEKKPIVVAQKKEEESPKGDDFDAELVSELNQIPQVVTANDIMVYKTICLKNTGAKTWPKNSFIKCVDNAQVGNTLLFETEAGKEFSTVLIIKSPEQVGLFNYTWKLGYKNEQGDEVFFGKSFTVSIKIEEMKAPEPEKESIQKKQYPADCVEKAKAVKEIFSEKDLDEICEFIQQVPNKTIDEIVEDYLGSL